MLRVHRVYPVHAKSAVIDLDGKQTPLSPTFNYQDGSAPTRTGISYLLISGLHSDCLLRITHHIDSGEVLFNWWIPEFAYPLFWGKVVGMFM